MVSGPDRLPLPNSLTEGQQAAVAAISAGPRGALFGPFVPLLRSPALMTRLQEVGAYLRFESAVPAHLRELVILMIAREWNQDFEWGHHVPLARTAGLGEQVIDALSLRAEITGAVGTPDVQAVWRLIRELLDLREVTDAAYAEALEAVGADGVVDLVATAGYYCTLAMTMNVARTPVPSDYERLPPGSAQRSQ